ncbi:hypothetical protein BJX68DRAFT_273336 [Aspergillus pseudodeflectus]|uniref:Uncharacterized protein n=1 Tax=Aspergillus pseudodeflectus TaxID=176178 RepID=A0ABR4J9W8_9EURO
MVMEESKTIDVQEKVEAETDNGRNLLHHIRQGYYGILTMPSRNRLTPSRNRLNDVFRAAGIGLNENDPTEPVLTLRVWVLSILFCVVASGLNTLYTLRTPSLTLSASVAVVGDGGLQGIPKTPSSPPPKELSSSTSTPTRPDPTQDLDLLSTYTSTVSCACILDPETSPRTSTALLFLLIVDPAGLRINDATTHLYEIHPARKYPRHITSDLPGGQSLAKLPPLTHLGSVEWDMEGDLLDVVDEAVYEVVRLRREEGDEDVGTFVGRFVRVMGELGWEW